MVVVMRKAIDHDIELMQRITQRDQAAFSELYQGYGKLVFSMAIRVVQNATLAEEVTQDTFMKVWNRPDAWDAEKGMLSTWLVSVTRYTAIDRLRKEASFHREQDDLDNA